MSLYDLFRGFFGFRGERRHRDPFFGGITRDDDEEDDDEDGPFFGARGSDDFGFGFTFGPGGIRSHDTFGFDELFRDFNNLFSEMGARSLPMHPFEFPGMEAPPPADRLHEKRQTLRDSMLKYPDNQRSGSRELEDGAGSTAPEKRPWRPFQGLQESQPTPGDVKDAPKEDRDLDSHVTSKGLETILLPSQPRSYFKSVSVTKVVAPDGTVEERRTVRDSQGHEETVVTRRSRGEPVPGLDSEQQSGSEDLAPLGSHHGQDMSDSFSILDAFLHRWFQRR
ncbi:HCLS1-associated protein X-1 [Elgaria multicarinata webbii]|uniref:HCLS1-associated protein X-1 n=1 Tax=Elgaria multicarinata webbii TaxID=159646 RepID=UPI002FCCC6CE